MTVRIEEDYAEKDVSHFEELAGSRVEFPLTLAWTRAAEISGYATGIRAMAFRGEEPVALAQGIVRRRLGFRKLMCGSTGARGLDWRPGYEDEAVRCLDDLAHRARPSVLQVSAPHSQPVRRMTWQPAYSFEIALSRPLDGILSHMAHDARHSIRKAVQNGVQVVVHPDLATVGQAYELVEWTAKRRHFIVPPRGYSVALHREFAIAGKQAAIVAYFEGHQVSVATLLGYGNKVTWWKGGSTDEAYKLRAGNLVQLVALQWAKEQGFRVYDLGGTEPHDSSYEGIHKFKTSLGGDLVTTALGTRLGRIARVAIRVLRGR